MSHENLGLRVHLGWDKNQGARGDVLTKAVMWEIIGLILRRVVSCWHVAPECRTFGTLAAYIYRSRKCILGFDTSNATTRNGNAMAFRTAFIMFLANAYDQLVSCEQPVGSIMRFLDLFQRMMSTGAFYDWIIPSCAFGSPFLKSVCFSM